MKKLFVALLVLSSSMMFGQIAKTGGLLYSNGNPNTRGIDTLVTKNLSKNSEVCIDYTTGTIYTFNRSDSSFVKYDSRPYKVYTAILNQSGTSAPVATVLENTLGDTVIWSREIAGTYLANNSSGLFVARKTFVFYNGSTSDAGEGHKDGFEVYRNGNTAISLITYVGTNATDLENLSNSTGLIEIRVYD